jgi:hypothetical protein
MLLPQAAGPAATTLAPDPASLLKELAALPGVWEAHPSSPASQGATTISRVSADRGDRSTEWPLPVVWGAAP